MKAERGRGAEAPERSPAIAAEQSLRGVLDDRGAGPARDVQQRIHLATDAGVVNGNDRARPRRDQSLNRRGIDVERIGPYVGKDGRSAVNDEGVRGRDEGIGRENDFVARLEIEKERRKLERVGARGRQEDLRDAQQFLEQLLALLREGAVAGRMAETDRFLDLRELVAAEEGLVERDAKLLRASRIARLHSVPFPEGVREGHQ